MGPQATQPSPAAPQEGLTPFPWGRSPHQPLLASPLLSAQRPFSGVPPSISPSRVCPPSLAWCLQLWSPPPALGQHHPAQVSFPRVPSPAMGDRDGSPGPSHPRSQNTLPKSAHPNSLAPPTPTSQPCLPCAPRKAPSAGGGVGHPLPLTPCPWGSVLSLVMW